MPGDAVGPDQVRLSIRAMRQPGADCRLRQFADGLVAGSPARAAQRNIEGWVLVEFSITALGTVKNAKVIQSEPGKIFNRSALKAVGKWKYKPRIEDGVAMETHGHRKRLKFTLSDQ